MAPSNAKGLKLKDAEISIHMLLDVPSSNDWSPDDGWSETISKLSVAQRFD